MQLYRLTYFWTQNHVKYSHKPLTPELSPELSVQTKPAIFLLIWVAKLSQFWCAFPFSESGLHTLVYCIPPNPHH